MTHLYYAKAEIRPCQKNLVMGMLRLLWSNMCTGTYYYVLDFTQVTHYGNPLKAVFTLDLNCHCELCGG